VSRHLLSLLLLNLALVCAAVALPSSWRGAGLRALFSETETVTGSVAAGAVQAPSNLACARTGLFTRQLQWTGAAGAGAYRIYHDGPLGDDQFELKGEVAAPATTYGGLVVSLLHHRWYVTALLGSWESGPSNVVEVHCRPALPFPGPCGVEAENHHSERVVELAWDAAPSAVLYGVLRGEQSGGPYEVLGTTSGIAYQDSAVADGVTYYYVVVAVDEQGNESDPSAEIPVPDVAPSPTPIDVDIADATPTPKHDPTVEPAAIGTATQTWWIGPDRVPAAASTPPDSALGPSPPTPSPADTPTVEYTVRAGESLSDVAAFFGTTVETIVALNGLADANLVVPGQVLLVPAPPANTAPGQAFTSEYVVQSGETLTDIAAQFGTTVEALAAENNLANPSAVRIGDRLLVP
jgi:LysM repeat protein